MGSWAKDGDWPAQMDAFLNMTEQLSKDGCLRASQYFQWQQILAGKMLWREGEKTGSVAMVLSGRLESLKETEFPGHSFVAGIYAAGSVVGEENFFTQKACMTSVRALETTELLTITQQGFASLLCDSPMQAVGLLKHLNGLLAKRLHHTLERLAIVF